MTEKHVGQNEVQRPALEVPKPLRVGFVGTGGITARHIQALQEIGNVEVAAITGRSVEKAEALIQKAGLGGKAAAYDDFQRMYGQANLDAVYITVIPSAHGQIEKSALDHNLALFVEKPLSADADTAEEIAAAIKAKGAISAVGYQMRYMNTTETAQELVKLHPARLALGHWLDSLPPPRWWSRQEESGGQVVEQSTHMFDLARLLVGEVKQVYALGRNTSSPESGIDVDRVSVVTLEFANGVIGTISSTSLLKSKYRDSLELIADGLTLSLTHDHLLIDEGKGQARTEELSVDPFIRINYDFLDAVAGGTNRIRSDYADALKTHRVTQAAARAARENRVVTIEG
ncbi:MAG: Gfo/Idh/MocA family oxidoreductase [Chloroflexi bacterium]|nr:Gfo/Idh/MocA family oxidoreductase [Chloroflexota bacterium]